MLPHRRLDSHKGSHGHLLVVAGSLGKSGAGILASQAATAGWGWLGHMGFARCLAPAMASHLTEVMTLPVAETMAGSIAEAAGPTLWQFYTERMPLCLVQG